MQVIRIFVGVGAALLLANAHAQPVNRCQVNGQWVYQASPCSLPAPALHPAAAALAPAAAPSAPAKKKTLADMLRERDGANPSRPVAREFEQDGANVLRSRMGAV